MRVCRQCSSGAYALDDGQVGRTHALPINPTSISSLLYACFATTGTAGAALGPGCWFLTRGCLNKFDRYPKRRGREPSRFAPQVIPGSLEAVGELLGTRLRVECGARDPSSRYQYWPPYAPLPYPP